MSSADLIEKVARHSDWWNLSSEGFTSWCLDGVEMIGDKGLTSDGTLALIKELLGAAWAPVDSIYDISLETATLAAYCAWKEGK